MFLRRDKHSPLVDAARKEVGYRAQVNRSSAFGRQARYDGQPWNGSFLDHILRTAGLHEVSTVSTVTALSYYTGQYRLKKTPKVGDIVFYNFPTNPLHPFEQPHVGVVTDTIRWKTDGLIRVIEGETGTGSPRGSQEIDGVFERTRGQAQVLGFVTPRAPKAVGTPPESEKLPRLQASYFRSNPKTVRRATSVLQRVLARIDPSLVFSLGMWDAQTQAALDNFRRSHGMLSKTGLPDEGDLILLHRASGGAFRLGDSNE